MQCKSYSHFSAKDIRILYIESAKSVNETTLNELVKLTTLRTTGPEDTFSHFMAHVFIFSFLRLIHSKLSLPRMSSVPLLYSTTWRKESDGQQAPENFPDCVRILRLKPDSIPGPDDYI